MSSGITFHKTTAKCCCLGEWNRFQDPWLLGHLQKSVVKHGEKAQHCTLPAPSTLHPPPFLAHFLFFPPLCLSAVFSPRRKMCAEGSGRGEMEWVGRKPKGRENEKEAIRNREGECESMGRWEGRGVYEWMHRQNEDKRRIWEGRNESGWDCIHQVLILALTSIHSLHRSKTFLLDIATTPSTQSSPT